MANKEFITSVFDKIDDDKDGNISMEELIGAFKSFDKDGDGKVTKDEFYANFKEKFSATEDNCGRIFPKLDIDGDGVAEVKELKDFFKDMDKDGDNKVSKADFVEFWAKVLA